MLCYNAPTQPAYYIGMHVIPAGKFCCQSTKCTALWCYWTWHAPKDMLWVYKTFLEMVSLCRHTNRFRFTKRSWKQWRFAVKQYCLYQSSFFLHIWPNFVFYMASLAAGFYHATLIVIYHKKIGLEEQIWRNMFHCDILGFHNVLV